jgi:hypothetical protein
VSAAGNADLSAAKSESDTIREKYRESLDRIFTFRDRIRHIHPFLDHLHPVALVEDQHLFVFEPDTESRSYVPTVEGPAPMPIPDGIRAAFPLELLDGRPACVVTGEVFDTVEGYITIFHEFVHCRQIELSEFELKEGLKIYQAAMEREDYMWEINHPFPYADFRFEALYSAFLSAGGDLDEIFRIRQALRTHLSEADFEYMVWQEWKEGFARFIENLIRLEKGVDENKGGAERPFGRVSFYAGGEAFIRALEERDPSLANDIKALFHTMLTPD